MAEFGLVQDSTYNPVQICLASMVSGGVADLILHPLDTVKSRQQAAYNARASIMDTSRVIWRNNGVSGFYKGYMPVLIFGSIVNPWYFGAYTIVKDSWSERFPGYDISGQVMGAVSAEVAISSFAVPEAVVKKRMQVEAGKMTDMKTMIKQMYKQEGFGVFYAGYLAQLLTLGPFSVLYFVQYEMLKNFWTDAKNYSKLANEPEYTVSDLSSISHFTCSTTSGLLATAFTHPLDTVSTRLQVKSDGGNKYTGLRQTITRILAEEGYAGFTKGLTVRAMWMVPWMAISNTMFEQGLHIMRTQKQEELEEEE